MLQFIYFREEVAKYWKDNQGISNRRVKESALNFLDNVIPTWNPGVPQKRKKAQSDIGVLKKKQGYV